MKLEILLKPIIGIKIDITNVRRFVNITLMKNTPYFLETINEIAKKSFNIFFSRIRV
jgi:hypothetical protein